MQPHLANQSSWYMHDISSNLHGMGDIDRLFARQILRQNSLSSHFSVEDHIKTIEVTEDSEGPWRVGNRQRHIASRHVPMSSRPARTWDNSPATPMDW